MELLQTTLDGLLDGGAYALVGLGLTFTFGTLRRINLAYGAGAMLAAYCGAWLHQRLDAPAVVVLIAVVAVAAVLGLYVEWLCFPAARDAAGDAASEAGSEGQREATRGSAPVSGADGREVVALASSFAIWMQLEQLAVQLLPQHLNPFASLASTSEWSLGPLAVRPDRLALALVAVLSVVALDRWLHATRGGLAWRAAADQQTAAHLVGIAVPRVQRLAFAAACGLSGMAAFAVLAIDGQVTPMFGMWVLLKGLVAAMLGGLGSVRGVLAGGLLLGVIEAHAQSLFGALGREFATFLLLFAVLVVPLGRGWPRRAEVVGV